MLGSKLLCDWRTKEGLNQSQAALRLEISQPGYWGWENGAIPKVAQALRIESITEGAVPIGSWSTAEEAAE
jgi:predicted DNA-binding protein (UPF0251 family)